ncbi:leucyl-trna synthetase [Holotrichia oblita]|nr:leucyl-trna synthetase [Holotrichia oblita]
MKKIFLQTINDYQLIRKGDSIILGFSGGADSLYALHVHHGLRGAQADRDLEFCMALCANLNIPFEACYFNIKEIAKETGASIEEAGREKRYEAFRAAAVKHGANKIAVAHNMNDQAETLLMRLFRGTGIKGLAGMKPKAGDIIRPLLFATRIEIEEYCFENKLEFITDTSNYDTEYTRSNIRRTILPKIENEFNSNIIRTLSRTALLISEENELLNTLTEKHYALCSTDNGILIDELKKLEIALQKRIIRRAVSEYSLKDISSEHVCMILSLINGPTGKQIDLPAGLTAWRDYGFLRIGCTKKAVEYSYDLIPGKELFVKEEYGGVRMETISVLISTEELNKKLDFLAEQISKDYDGKTITFICVLKGAVMFMTDLAKRIHLNIEFDFMDVSSYGYSTTSSGQIKINKDLEHSIEGEACMKVIEYKPQQIEKKWQEIWENEKAFEAETKSSKPKFYALVEFPYPSGEGLHVGAPRPYTALDIIARKRRMQGYNVLLPMGFDAFGLPAENFAIKNKIHPKIVTERNINRFRSQMKSIGLSYDWSRQVDTTDPKYYKWTQWIFLKFFEHGLAYKAEIPINWCTSCKIGLANEEVVGGACERCGGEVERKVKSQWMLKITDYAQKLIDGLDTVDYIDRVKTQQLNWIGRSEGAEVLFKVEERNEPLTVYTTRPDTLFGATYMVLSPEHPLIDELSDKITNIKDVLKYRDDAGKKSDFERTELAKDKTGVSLEGISAVNPVTNKQIPIWVSDYVLMSYGTGAIMAVPAHDTRDWEFAKKFELPIIEVISGGDIEKEAYTDVNNGIMVNSGFLNGLVPSEAIEKMKSWLKEKGLGEPKVNYKLRDWVFSRQRYWGEPIPIIKCPDCGFVAVPYEELPLTLPDVENYLPTDTGESPLANIHEWVNTKCPKCGKPAKRETDTMPNWAGSSWYFLRYTDPHNDNEFASKESLDYWMNVDWYNGGMEHTTLHLLYSRFWHKFLYDLGYVNTPEPYQKRTSHGMILGANGEKMSKSRGNVINPDEIIAEFGADTLRTYEMFIGAFELSAAWQTEGIKGCRRFLDRVWKLREHIGNGSGYSENLIKNIHKTIKKVAEDYEKLKFNTAVAAMMTLTNDFYAADSITKADYEALILLLSPVAPHMSEELWQLIGNKGYVYKQKWPVHDEKLTIDDVVEMGVQINGKLKGTITVSLSDSQEQAVEKCMASPNIAKNLEDKQIKKVIYVPGLLIVQLGGTREVAPTYTYNELLKQIRDHQIEKLEIKKDSELGNAGQVKVYLKDNQTPYTLDIITLDTFMETVEKELSVKDYTVKTALGAKTGLLGQLIIPIIILVVSVFLLIFIMQQMQGGGGRVAGLEEEKRELEELVDFLKAPKKYIEIGARIPKGILLVGPPGTGKTYLAKAVSGEAGVPFFSISGSDFVEMFVGVGASRVRDLFEQSKKNSPCIIFIDEIDAVGRRRGAGLGGGHDEREQTLNQLLVEMDGFGVNEGIIIIAATNRPDILDPALLRPGRFDRRVVVGKPDVKGREAVLKIHAKGKLMAADVSLKEIAQTTSGFTPADLENLLNEAALLSARADKKEIDTEELKKALVKIGIGTEKKSRVISEKEKNITAYHEAGHAILFEKLAELDPVHIISIIPTGVAGGYTMPLPGEDRGYITKRFMEQSIVSLLGGRAAEELVLNDITTGASSDIERATSIARSMVTKYGMSEALGPIQFGDDNDEVFIGRDLAHARNYGENVASTIDSEIKRIVETAYKEALRIINDNIQVLHKTADMLKEKEKISGDEFRQLFL